MKEFDPFSAESSLSEDSAQHLADKVDKLQAYINPDYADIWNRLGERGSKVFQQELGKQFRRAGITKDQWETWMKDQVKSEAERQSSEDIHKIIEGIYADVRHTVFDAIESELKTQDAEIRAITDSLTGAFTRAFLQAESPKIIEACFREKKPMSVLALDMDLFKSVNDTYGHDVGDAAIKEYVKRIQANIRGSDYCVRTGGEEILVLLPNTSVQEANEIGKRINEAMKATPLFEATPLNENTKETVTKTVSIGVASTEHIEGFSATPDSHWTAALGKNFFELLAKRSDEAMYRAKKTRDTVNAWEPTEL